MPTADTCSQLQGIRGEARLVEYVHKRRSFPLLPLCLTLDVVEK